MTWCRLDKFDVRLYAPSLGLWAGMVAAGLQAWIVAVVISAITVIVVFRMFRPVAVVAVVAVAFAGIGAGAMYVHRSAAERGLSQIRDAQVRGLISFQVLDDPRLRIRSDFDGLTQTQQLSTLVEVVQVDSAATSISSLLAFDADFVPAGFEWGSRWECEATLTAVADLRRYVTFGECLDDPRLVETASKLWHFTTLARTGLQQVTVQRRPDQLASTLLPGLVVGDTSAQSAQLQNALQQSGLGHLTAVSGANVAIVIGAVLFILRRTRLSQRVVFVIAAIVLIAFVATARPSPSVVRAAAMGGIGLWIVYSGRPKDAARIIAIAVGGLLCIDPMLSVDFGFALSVAATIGLIFLPRTFFERWSRSALGAVAVTAVAAALATLPVLLLMGKPPTVVSIAANIAADMWVAPATVFGCIALISSLWPPIAAVFADLGMACAAVIVRIAYVASESRWSYSVISFTFLVVSVMWIVLWHIERRGFIRPRKAWLIAAAVLLLSGFAPQGFSVHRIPDDWHVVACDVGQGDATVIRASSDSAIVIDAGPNAALMDECLDSLGINRIELFVPSHLHADHVGGIDALLRGRTVERVWISPVCVPIVACAAVRNLSPDVVEVQPGITHQFAGGSLELLFADTRVIADPTDGTSVNNSSLVLVAHVDDDRYLLTGDLETSGQAALMARGELGPVTAVKIPHHGSKYQHPNFPRWTSAKFAWVSVGIDNDYGHPAPETVASYTSQGIRVLATALCGALYFTSTEEPTVDRACAVS